MGVGVCYLVRESVRGNVISHEFRTKKLLEAIADWLLKVRSPITNHVNRSSWKTDVRVQVNSYPTRFKVDGFFDYEIRILEKFGGDLIIKIEVRAELYKGDAVFESKGCNLEHYNGKSSEKTRRMLEHRLASWSEEDLGALSVLACCASVDPDHIFWLEQGYMDKALNLAM